MGTTTDQIESHIEHQREDLRSNLEELEARVKSVTDWRRQFRRSPALGLGLAFGGGLLLAAVLGARARREPGYRPVHAARRESGQGRRPMRHAWDNLQSAVIGVAAARATDALTQVLHGFIDRLAGSDGAGSPAEPRASGNGVRGEGDYRAARRYRAAAERFAHTADVRSAARGAAPRDEAEAAEMAEAEARGLARGKPS